MLPCGSGSSPRMPTSVGLVMRIVVQRSCEPSTQSWVFPQPARVKKVSWRLQTRSNRSATCAATSAGALSRAGRQDGGAIVGRELLVGALQAGLVAAGDDHPALE